MERKKLIEKLWKIRQEGKFVNFDEKNLYSKKELTLLNLKNV